MRSLTRLCSSLHLLCVISRVFLKLYLVVFLGFPGGSAGKEPACNAGDHVQSLGWEDPLEEGMAVHSSKYSCLETPHGQRSLEGYSPWGHKEPDTAEGLSTAQHSRRNGQECLLHVVPASPVS